MSDKNKAILTVALSIVILAGIFLYHGITHHNNFVKQVIKDKDVNFHARIKALEKFSFGPYSVRISNMLQLKPQIVTALANRNREQLYSSTLPVYEALAKENPYFKVINFHLPDGSTFLRMHNPDSVGDSLRNIRPIIDNVNKAQKQLSGYEIDRQGSFYRIAQPVFFENTFVGVMEFGIEVHQLVEAAEINLSDKAASYFLDREWQKVDYDNHYKMRRFGGFLLNTHGDSIYKHLSSKIDLNIHINQIELDNKVYILHAEPVFKNYHHEVVGGITILQDITSLIQQKNSYIVRMSALVILLTVLCLSILYISFNNLVGNLIKTKKKLLVTVDELSAEVKERKKAENRALEAQDEWEKTFNAMSDIVTIQDINMLIVRANRAAYNFFEAKQGELEGKKCHEVFRGSLQPCPGCPGVDVFEDTHNHSEIIEHKELGKIFQVSSAPLFNKDNEVRFLVHVARDITEHKKMEEELFQAHKMEAMGTLAGGIAHDFNNILTAILGFSEFVKSDLPEESKARQNIEQVISSGQRAAQLVKQILTFSRKADQQQHPFQPHLIIKEALNMLRSTLPTTIAIEEHIDPECGSILANPTNIHQIVVNLCTNAYHAMENEKGTLTVSLSRTELRKEDIIESDVSPGPFVELSIQDTGQGMDKKTMARIFEPYYTTKDVGKGSGLGLAVIHGIVKTLHGFTQVESEPGKGSTFHVYIPALEEVAATSATIQQKDIPEGTERILVVDDESIIVDLNAEILEQLGYTVTATTSSVEALEKICTHPDDFDLVITDQAMPNLSGVEMAQEILKIKPDMPIILCSGYSSVVTEEGALASGIKKYVMKPVDLTVLAQMVRELLDET